MDGEPGGSLTVPFAMTMMSSVGPSVGYDHGSAVSPRYAAPFAFEGTLERVEIDVVGRSPRAEAVSGERSSMSRQ